MNKRERERERAALRALQIYIDVAESASKIFINIASLDGGETAVASCF
jgi:hypothetical protein